MSIHNWFFIVYSLALDLNKIFMVEFFVSQQVMCSVIVVFILLFVSSRAGSDLDRESRLG